MHTEIANVENQHQSAELVTISYNDSNRPTVSGRELHEALKVKTAYKDWFPRMCEYGFVEGVDFCSKMSESTGGRPSTDHQLTIAMAKEVCMIQRTDIGKQIRQYFIRIEEEWNSPEKLMARALKVANDTINEMKPKAAYFDMLVDRNMLTSLQKTGKQLGVHPNKFIWWMVNKGILYYSKNRKELLPYQLYLDKGYFKINDWAKQKGKGKGIQTLVTPRGKEALRLLLESPEVREEIQATKASKATKNVE